MNDTLKYFLLFGIITVLLVVVTLSETDYRRDIEQNHNSPVIVTKQFYYENDSVSCFYRDYNGVKSYLGCVQVESQTVLK